MNTSSSAGFTTTNWSLVLAAMDTGPASANAALNRLCTRYWFPIYAFVRRQGCDVHHAEDLTQGFFEFLLEHDVIQKARRERGRFRSFILGSLRNFLHNQHDRAAAAKRGGGFAFVPLDAENAELLLASEPAGCTQPEQSFDRRWAATLARRAMENLRERFAERDRAALHDELLPYLTGTSSRTDHERISAKLGMTVNALKVALTRMRGEFGELLRKEVANTVASVEEVDEELRYLVSVLMGG